MPAKTSFAEAMKERVILGDGGMGSQIYSQGVFLNRCFDELSLTSPILIRDIHRAFLKAGSELIETNTYGANRPKLAPHGLDAKLEDILTAGVKLARDEAGDGIYVAGSMGPLGSAAKEAGMGEDEQRAAYAEVAEMLAGAGADLIYLDTFTSIHDLHRAIVASKRVTDLPVVASFSFHRGFIMGHNDFLVAPEDVAAMATKAGADAVGANCGDGPHTTLDVVEALNAAGDLPVSAMPNIGGPALIEGRSIYLSSPEYMAEYSRRFVQKQARLIGGCCGVTADEIREISSFLLSVQPRNASVVVSEPEQPAEAMEAHPVEARTPWGAKIGKEFAISVELDPPPGLDASKAIESARFLKDHGIDAVNIADGPRAIARMSPTALAVQVQQQTGMETIIHYCCRDRNVLAMQMDLIGANSLGLKNLMLITGDPPKMGNFPDATAVFDVDSVGLIGFAHRLNRGLDLGGKSLGQQTDFVIGTGCNPGAMDLEREAERFGAKIAAGAEFTFCQPVYETELLTRFLESTADLPEIPFFVGILPLASLKNAEFLTREVPGMAVPDSVLSRLRDCKTRDEQREVGIRVAADNLAVAMDHPRVKGAYIFPPFGRYEAILRVLKESGARD
jgi:homocysteine S-methyltransferase